ncbi:MAG: UDP-N-acetylmuramate--L-alanine ligase, partial [Lachnospiraceae bacterium]|nr:UDP-N-acetylmuramate--L-alanine ligase [Lachnospiraceae bacterium]
MYQIDLKKPISIYFVGIGGVSMSGLAEILSDAGFRVSGSDRAPSELCTKLEGMGIKIYYGQKAENITDDIDCAVLTAAIRPDNPEYMALTEKGIPMLTRGQLLGQLMKNYELPIAIS